MQDIFISYSIFMTAVSFILAVRLVRYRRQTGHIIEELSMLDREDTNYRLSSCCRAGKTGQMIGLFNEILERRRGELAELKRENDTYKESITGISHDIRTPLTSAKGYLQMLSKEDASDMLSPQKRKEYITTVEQRVDDVTDMLNQLFAYARVEAGEMEFHMERLNFANLFMDTLSMFYEDFVQKGSEPSVEVLQNPCYVFADRHALTRILENLIKNALIHGTGEFSFCMKLQGDKVCLRMANRTDSIEQKDIGRIFDRFYTTDVSRMRKTTGIGLAVVKQFANHMNADVSASLEKDKFTMEISFPNC